MHFGLTAFTIVENTQNRRHRNWRKSAARARGPEHSATLGLVGSLGKQQLESGRDPPRCVKEHEIITGVEAGEGILEGVDILPRLFHPQTIL